MVTFVTGDPGSGKSTRAGIIATSEGTEVFSVGAFLNGEVRAGRMEPMASGNFGDDQLALHAVVHAILNHGHTVIDGFPRRQRQVWEMLSLMKILPIQPWSIHICRISVEEAIARYLVRGFRRSAKSGKYGPEGGTCPAGGTYELDDIEDHYPNRRYLQELELALAVESIERLKSIYVAGAPSARDPKFPSLLLAFDTELSNLSILHHKS